MMNMQATPPIAEDLPAEDLPADYTNEEPGDNAKVCRCK